MRGRTPIRKKIIAENLAPGALGLALCLAAGELQNLAAGLGLGGRGPRAIDRLPEWRGRGLRAKGRLNAGGWGRPKNHALGFAP